MTKREFTLIELLVVIAIIAVLAAMLLSGTATAAEIPALEERVPTATGYELIVHFDPTKYNLERCRVDRSRYLSGKITKIGYLVILPHKNGNTEWVFAEMDPFTQDMLDLAVPTGGGRVLQKPVKNLTVYSNSPNIKTGTFAEGNLEIWGCDYGKENSKKIPGARDDSFDFGDQCNRIGFYGSFQLHNTLEKQTLFAFNGFGGGSSCDLGIGNAPAGYPDWTFSRAGKNFSNPEIMVVAKIENLKVSQKPVMDSSKFMLLGSTNRNAISYLPGEEMIFSLKGDFADQTPEGLLVEWIRTGDDGERVIAHSPIAVNSPAVFKTSLVHPGFVRIKAKLLDSSGRQILTGGANSHPIEFDGGAGVQPEKLTSQPEPADFDRFWDKQKKRLAAVPIKSQMHKVKTTASVEVFAVSVDCAGARPVTGYLTIPLHAQAKSLPARATFHGYGISVQNIPNDGPEDEIVFDVNAHGYDLGKDAAYYKDFFNKIHPTHYGYAMDPLANSNPETAYFNSMALRVMRAIEFLKTLPQWNQQELRASGISQGGLQAIWAAGLDADVTSIQVHVPWCSYLVSSAKLNHLGADGGLPYVPALDYYDTVNHAKRIKCQVEIIRAGLGDYVCPPSGIARFYNNLRGAKKITYYQGSTHNYVPPAAERFTLEEANRK